VNEMNSEERHLAAAWAIPEICHQHGVTHAIMAPGSRCAPLTLAFVRHPKIACLTIPDERAGAYAALGLAQQLKKTVVLICTSGTAALNFSPAISEAFYQQVPLLVLTADRPNDWIDQRDGQTIHQDNIYAGHVKKASVWPVDMDHPDSRWSGGRMLSELLSTAQRKPSGPVHLNIPLREPLYPKTSYSFPLPPDLKIIQTPEVQTILAESAWEPLLAEIRGADSILFLAGQSPPDSALSTAIVKLAKQCGTVILADLLANLPAENTVCHLYAQHASLWSSTAPTLLISFGMSILSKKIKQVIRKNPPRIHWHVEDGSGVADTLQSMTRRIPVDPNLFFDALCQKLSPRQMNPVAAVWQAKERSARQFSADFFSSRTASELEAVARIISALPSGSHLHLANSMSVRYACMLGMTPPNGAVWANRGTSGIDGCLATAVGHALVSNNMHIVIIGDMAFQYGRNALWQEKIPANLRIVVLNNGGGRIFELIDGPDRQPECADYFVTRQRFTAKQAALEYGLDYSLAEDLESVLTAIVALFAKAEKAKLLEVCLDHEISRECYQKFSKGE
jgi:2-succinyl-5-enolpyruvyl-6-hydroxy-3-cyclohexene-1-carboxylate synthase